MPYSFDNIPHLIAILRGIKPDEILAVAEVLILAGFKAIEIPLNSPTPYESIRLLVDKYGDQCLIGAGTVVSVDQVERVKKSGGQLIVSPNIDVEVIEFSKANNMVSLPGCMTPTEAMQAIKAGADGLKVFPANIVSESFFKALSSVLPEDVPLFAVGGIDQTNMSDFYKSGAYGFGFGSCLYKPGDKLDEINSKAKSLVEVFQNTLLV